MNPDIKAPLAILLFATLAVGCRSSSTTVNPLLVCYPPPERPLNQVALLTGEGIQMVDGLAVPAGRLGSDLFELEPGPHEVIVRRYSARGQTRARAASEHAVDPSTHREVRYAYVAPCVTLRVVAATVLTEASST